jgi:transcriptional regulator with XRE-family HTH domain
MPLRDNPEDLRVVVAFLRLLRGWTQAELGEAAALSASAISRYENGDIVPTHEVLEEIAAAVGMPLRMLKRVTAWARAARAAIASAADPADPDLLAEAVVSELSAELLDLFGSVAGLLADLPDLGADPWRQPAAPPRPEDREEAPELWEVLKRREPSVRRVLVEDSRRFRKWALCELLCAESRRVEGGPDQGLELAELALRIAELVPGEESWRLRLQGYAWAHIGLARKGENLPEAEEAFTRAVSLWEAGAPGDPGLLDESRIVSRAAVRSSESQS